MQPLAINNTLFILLHALSYSSTPSEYKEYQEATQKEYSHLDETTYKKTRLRVSFI